MKKLLIFIAGVLLLVCFQARSSARLQAGAEIVRDKPQEWPPVKPGTWTTTITTPLEKKRTIDAEENCRKPELIFWKSFFEGHINLGGCRFSSKKLSDTEYLFTGECGTEHNGLAVMRNHITMMDASSFHDSVETTQQGKTTKWSMDGHWLRECIK